MQVAETGVPLCTLSSAVWFTFKLCFYMSCSLTVPYCRPWEQRENKQGARIFVWHWFKKKIVRAYCVVGEKTARTACAHTANTMFVYTRMFGYSSSLWFLAHSDFLFSIIAASKISKHLPIPVPHTHPHTLNGSHLLYECTTQHRFRYGSRLIPGLLCSS